MADKGPPCRECGQEVVPNVDARYALADKWDADGNLIESCHFRCYRDPLEELKGLVRQMDETKARVQDILGGLKGKP